MMNVRMKAVCRNMVVGLLALSLIGGIVTTGCYYYVKQKIISNYRTICFRGEDKWNFMKMNL